MSYLAASFVVPPPFSRSHNLGSELRLPRGRLTLEKNSDFFKSVHLTGEGLALEKAETKRLEKAAWMSKVVVDSLDFKVYIYECIQDFK